MTQKIKISFELKEFYHVDDLDIFYKKVFDLIVLNKISLRHSIKIDLMETKK